MSIVRDQSFSRSEGNFLHSKFTMPDKRSEKVCNDCNECIFRNLIKIAENLGTHRYGPKLRLLQRDLRDVFQFGLNQGQGGQPFSEFGCGCMIEQ